MSDLEPERRLTLRQADQAREDFAQILDELDFMRGQIARLPTKSEVRGLGLRQSGGCRDRASAYRVRLYRDLIPRWPIWFLNQRRLITIGSLLPGRARSADPRSICLTAACSRSRRSSPMRARMAWKSSAARV